MKTANKKEMKSGNRDFASFLGEEAMQKKVNIKRRIGFFKG
jgi:hypothetical protein